jgi:hypothetical protein
VCGTVVVEAAYVHFLVGLWSSCVQDVIIVGSIATPQLDSALSWLSWRSGHRGDLRVRLVTTLDKLPVNSTYIGAAKVECERWVHIDLKGNVQPNSVSLRGGAITVSFIGGLVLPAQRLDDTIMNKRAVKLGFSEEFLSALSVFGYPWWLHCVFANIDKNFARAVFSWFWMGKIESHASNFSTMPLSFDQCSVAAEMVVQLMKTSQKGGDVPDFVKRYVPGLVLPVSDFQGELFMRRHELLAASEDYYLSHGDGHFLDIFRWAVCGPLMTACVNLHGKGAKVEHGGEVMVSVLYSLAYGVPDQLFGYLTYVREKRNRSWYAFREKPSKSFPDNKIRRIVPLINGVGVEMKLIAFLKQLVAPIPGTIVVQKNGEWQLYVPPMTADDVLVKVVAHFHEYILSLTKNMAKLMASRK